MAGCARRRRPAPHTGVGVTVYGPHNALGAAVREAGTGQLVRGVTQLDTDTGVVTCVHLPARLNAAGDAVDVYERRFTSIVVLPGAVPGRTLFLCYEELK